MAVERVEPSTTAPERAMLDGWLDYHRATLEWKCEELSAEQLRTRSAPPSNLSLLGLLRHMAEVERSWFRNVLVDENAPPLFYTDADPDGDFNDLEGAEPAEVLTTWRAECEHAREVSRPLSLDALSEGERRRSGERFSLRWIITHMIEEYARHNGHADLLREAIDGATGD
jgi:hypothetical protein